MYIKEIHQDFRAAVKNFPEEKLEEQIAVESKKLISYIERIYGVAAHDIYHTAQIRNMGVLKQ